MGLAAKVLAKAIKAGIEREAAMAAPAISKKAALEELRKNWELTSKKPAVIQAFEKGQKIGSAEQMNVAHPNSFGPFTGVKPRVPESEFSAKYDMLPGMEAPRKEFNFADAEHAHVIPIIADASRGGGRVVQIGDDKLDASLWAGPRYAEANALQGSAAGWANQPAPAGTLRNQIKEGLDQNKKVYGFTVTTAPTTADQSTMMSDITLQRLRLAKLLRKDVTEINEDARRIMPGFPGIHHPKAMEFLQKQIQPNRKSWIESLETNPRVAQGVPDNNQARLALTEPELRNVPAGAAGYSVMEFGPESLVRHTPTLEHPTYKSQIPGKFVGTMTNQLPYHMIAPGMYGLRRAAKAPVGSDFTSMMKAKWGGSLTPQSFDEAMGYLEQLKK